MALVEEQHPLVIDEATQLRDFEKSTLYYPSGAVEAGSTRFPLGTRAKAGKVERTAMEPVLFLANVVAVPVTYFFKPPFSSYDWHGVVMDPSYTVQPAYPAEAPATVGPTGGDAATPAVGPDGLVPPAQAPVPSPSEPVRDPSGAQPRLPTENQGVNEVPVAPADNVAEPVTPSGGATGGGAGGATPAPATPTPAP